MAVVPNENVLSARYATGPINGIFSERESNLYERRLWLAREQIRDVATKADTIISRYPKEAAYEPQSIL